MNKLVLILLLISSLPLQARYAGAYRTGDFIFQDLDCGGLCDAIEAVTKGYKDYRFSHVGMVYIKGQDTLVIEAIGSGVVLTPLDTFLARTTVNIPARLKRKYRNLIPEAVNFSLKQVGTAYDEAFLYDNGRYYCSELLYDAFKYANDGVPFFRLEPMTFRQPHTENYFPAWEAYYNKLGVSIPEGKPGCNPGGISRSGKLRILR